MTQVKTSKGAVALVMSGTEAVEIKATLPDRQIDAALTRYKLTMDEHDERYIYFFDTPDLSLFKFGVIARARRVVSDDHDSTLKFRPIDPAAIPAIWKKYKGFKIESDASQKGVVKSASLTMEVPKGLIKRVAAGEEPVASLFQEEQRMFLLATAKEKLDYARVVPLGPIQAWKWKFTDPGLPWGLTAELWQREDGERMFEASIKVPVVQAAAAMAGFKAFLGEVGAEEDNGQQAKTRWALSHYANR